MDEPNTDATPRFTHPQAGERSTVEAEGGQTQRERRIANIVLLLFVVAVVGGGIWLANALFNQRMLDDCIAQGRRNCAPVDAPRR